MSKSSPPSQMLCNQILLTLSALCISTLLVSTNLSALELKSKTTGGSSQATHSPSNKASKPSKIIFLPESSIKIDGDSSARKFSAVANPINLQGIEKPQPDVIKGLTWSPTELEMLIAVKDLKSGERTLDKHMQEALKAEQYPTIQMKLTSFNFPTSGSDPAQPLKASGTLTVAGVTKPIQLDPAISIEGEKVRIKGKTRILMTDFGIQPPTLMMGTLKTHNEIDVIYNVICSK